MFFFVLDVFLFCCVAFVIMQYLRFGSVLLVLFAFGIGFWAWGVLPDSVPVHWNAGGVADGFAGPVFGAFFMPLVMLFLIALFFLVPRIEVYRENFLSFEKQYWVLVFLVQFFFFALFLAMLFAGLGFEFNMNHFFIPALSLLFIGIGFLMPFFKRNFFVGIRTPWTLSSDVVWKKTHELGGRLFIVSGVLFLFVLFFSNDFFVPLLGLVVVLFFGLCAYSYFLYAREKK
jgi:uncharacterized membrane protein